MSHKTGYLNLALVSAEASAAENVASNVTEYRIDLMHEMLARLLAETDAASNFLIAPQEALKLYLQLHGTEEAFAADEAETAEVDANGEHLESNDLNTENSNAAVYNEVESNQARGTLKEFEEFFHIGESPILVSNKLYANAYATSMFTRKLKNLEFVIHEESHEDDKNSSSRANNDKSEGDSEGTNVDNNMSAVPMNAMNTIHNINNNSQHNHSHNHNNNNNKEHNELINTVRINSRWAHNFQKRDTHKRPFHMPLIHAHSYLNAMRKDDIFPYANLVGLNASALELSLQRWQLKMLIILPHAKDGLRHLLQRLSANVTLLDELCGMEFDTQQQMGPAGTIGNQRPHLDSTLVRVFLPKFEYTQRLVLDDIFQQLLNVTANVNLHWRSPWQVVQDVHFAVNEDGIGELKPSMVLFWNAFSSLRTKPLMFCVDHPFLFIVHNRQGIQLLGHVAQLHE